MGATRSRKRWQIDGPSGGLHAYIHEFHESCNELRGVNRHKYACTIIALRLTWCT